MLKMRTLVLGGLAVAAAAAALKNRDKVAGLIGARSSAPEPSRPEPSPAPGPSNYDASGPVANTATPVPAPEPAVRGEGAIDEKAEEEAAGAEAAAIGGETPEYSGHEAGQPAGEDERPVAEAGEGESEGFEQAEADLADNAEPSAGDRIEGERAVAEAIEAQDQPTSGERDEALRATEGGEADGVPPVEGDEAVEEKSPRLDLGDEADQKPPEPAAGAEEPAEGGEDTTETPASEKSIWSPPSSREDDGGEWQTWSGRAVRP